MWGWAAEWGVGVPSSESHQGWGWRRVEAIGYGPSNFVPLVIVCSIPCNSLGYGLLNIHLYMYIRYDMNTHVGMFFAIHD